MTMKRYNLLILLVALLLCFSLVFARVYGEKQNYISGAGGRAVNQNQSGAGLGDADFLLKKKHCMGCKLFMKHCCGYFCCTAAEYAKYMKGEAVLPHN